MITFSQDKDIWRCQLLSLPPPQHCWCWVSSSVLPEMNCNSPTICHLSFPFHKLDGYSETIYKKCQRTKKLQIVSLNSILHSPLSWLSHILNRHGAAHRGGRVNGKERTDAWGSTVCFRKDQEWSSEPRIQGESWPRLTYSQGHLLPLLQCS